MVTWEQPRLEKRVQRGGVRAAAGIFPPGGGEEDAGGVVVVNGFWAT